MQTMCKRCGAAIRFIRKPDGKYHVCEDKALIVITESGIVVKGYESHFSHCPYAKEFRKDNKM
ncbi:MAG: hypothetical protein ABIC39_02185 [Pseudomonadota bacterium]